MSPEIPDGVTLASLYEQMKQMEFRIKFLEDRVNRQIQERLSKASDDLQKIVDELRRSFGDDEGLSSVREPRNPYPTQDAGAGENTIPQEEWRNDL